MKVEESDDESMSGSDEESKKNEKDDGLSTENNTRLKQIRKSS